MMNEMIFNEISYIFCDFQLERDQPTDQPTDRPTDRASYRGAMAHLKTRLKSLKNKRLQITIQQYCHFCYMTSDEETNRA